MSHDITAIRVIRTNLRISKKNYRRALGVRRPEANPLTTISEGDFVDGFAKVEMDWVGEGAGNRFHDGSFDAFVRYLEGEAELVLVWEGGDSFSGIRICDGVATRSEVQFSLVDAPRKDPE